MSVAPAKTITYREAMREAIREALLADERVFLMGEDVGAYGGCFGVSKGLLDEFGPERIRDTPLSESAFVGAGIGAALGGERPIVEVMTVNFCLLALDQIMNNAATITHMSGGQFAIPLVIRMTTGAGRQVAAQHSHSLEGWLGPYPRPEAARAGNARRRARHARPGAGRPQPGADLRARIALQPRGRAAGGRRRGRHRARRGQARRRRCDTDRLRRHAPHRPVGGRGARPSTGIEAEVIDLRVLRPLDDRTVIESVARTHRAVVIDEGWRSGSLAAEVSARIMEQAFYDLDAPVARVCSAEVPMPYPRHLEQAALPQAQTVVDEVRRMIGAGFSE